MSKENIDFMNSFETNKKTNNNSNENIPKLTVKLSKNKSTDKKTDQNFISAMIIDPSLFQSVENEQKKEKAKQRYDSAADQAKKAINLKINTLEAVNNQIALLEKALFEMKKHKDEDYFCKDDFEKMTKIYEAACNLRSEFEKIEQKEKKDKKNYDAAVSQAEEAINIKTNTLEGVDEQIVSLGRALTKLNHHVGKTYFKSDFFNNTIKTLEKASDSGLKMLTEKLSEENINQFKPKTSKFG